MNDNQTISESEVNHFPNNAKIVLQYTILDINGNEIETKNIDLNPKKDTNGSSTSTS